MGVLVGFLGGGESEEKDADPQGSDVTDGGQEEMPHLQEKPLRAVWADAILRW